jgi:hypothetical protein
MGRYRVTVVRMSLEELRREVGKKRTKRGLYTFGPFRSDHLVGMVPCSSRLQEQAALDGSASAHLYGLPYRLRATTGGANYC